MRLFDEILRSHLQEPRLENKDSINQAFEELKQKARTLDFLNQVPPLFSSRAYISRKKIKTVAYASLGLEERKAWQFFAQQGKSLGQEFSEADLKKAWRALALRTHPDTTGKPSAMFIAVMKNFRLLKALFVTKSIDGVK